VGGCLSGLFSNFESEHQKGYEK